MSISYYLMNPTGNITILVETPTPVERESFIASRLMKAEPTAEQVGFVSTSPGCDISLRMAGGEFCGNATMSTAALYLLKSGLPEAHLNICVSGAPDPVSVFIKAESDDTCRGEVEMPPVKLVENIHFPEGYTLPVVHFDGISHIIVEDGSLFWDAREIEVLIRKWCEMLKVDALGMMLLGSHSQNDEVMSGADLTDLKLTPYVYVPAADTLFRENSCGSGSSAIGAFYYDKYKKTVNISLIQPGGSLRVTATDSLTILSGTVTLEKHVSDFTD